MDEIFELNSDLNVCPTLTLEKILPYFDFKYSIYRKIKLEKILSLVREIKKHTCEICLNHPLKGRFPIINGKRTFCSCISCKSYKIIEKVIDYKKIDKEQENDNDYKKIESYFTKIIKHFFVLRHRNSWYGSRLKVNYNGHYSYRNDPENKKICRMIRNQYHLIDKSVLDFYPTKTCTIDFLFTNFIDYRPKPHLLSSRFYICDCETCNIDSYFRTYVFNKNPEMLYEGFGYLVQNWNEFLDRIKFNEINDIFKSLDVLRYVIKKKKINQIDILAIEVLYQYFNSKIQPVLYTKTLKLEFVQFCTMSKN